MPRKSKRKTYRKKRKRANYSLSTISRHPLPNTYFTKLMYVQVVDFNPEGSGVCSVATWRANDLRDPYQPTGGHQPRGYDEMMAFYDEFVVVGSRIKVEFTPVGSGASNDGICYGITLKDDSVAVQSDYTNYIETGNTNYAVSDINIKNPAVRSHFSLKKWADVDDPMSLGAYAGNATASPTNEAYWDVWIGAADQITDVSAYSGVVTIEYSAVFRKPKLLAAS